MARIRTGTIVIEQPVGGWGSDQFASISSAVQVGKNQYSKSVAVSLFRNGLPGQIAPGETFTVLTDASTRINELPLNGDVASNGEAFMVLRNGRLVQFGVGDDTVDTHNDPTAAAPNHSGHTIQTKENGDLLIIKTSSNELVLSGWEDDSDADIMKINSDGTSLDSDWFSTLSGSGVLTKNVPHKMMPSPIANKVVGLNGQYLFEADVVAGTGNTQRINLGAGWIGASITRRGNYIVVIGYKGATYLTSFARGNVRVWLWNGYSPNPDIAYDIDDNYATAIQNAEGILLAYTQGRNNTTKVLALDPDRSSNFELVFQSALIGNSPRHGATEMYQGAAHFAQQNGEGLYVFDGGFHYRALVTDGTNQASDIGMIKNFSTSLLYAGIKTGSSYKVYKINHSGYSVDADFRTGLITLPFKSRLVEYRTYLSQFGSGAKLLESLFKNYTTASLGGAADLLNYQLSNATHGAITEKRFRREIDGVSAFYMNFRFNHTSVSDTAAIMRRCEVDYEELPGMP